MSAAHNSPIRESPVRESYHVAEIPGVTGFTRTQTWKLISTGELPSFKVNRRRYVRAQTLRDFLKRRETAARPRAQPQPTP